MWAGNAYVIRQSVCEQAYVCEQRVYVSRRVYVSPKCFGEQKGKSLSLKYTASCARTEARKLEDCSFQQFSASANYIDFEMKFIASSEVYRV